MPTDRMARYEIFIGTWNTHGDVLAVDDAPESVLSATDTYRWGPGEQCIVHDVDARFGTSVSRSMEVIGYDRTRRSYVARSYDDQGMSEEFELALRGRHWSIKGASVRFDGAFTKKGDTLVGLWEMKDQRGRWKPWIRLTLARA